jgi:hypothetical protein
MKQHQLPGQDTDGKRHNGSKRYIESFRAEQIPFIIVLRLTIGQIVHDQDQDQPDLYLDDEDVTAEAPSSNERAPQQNFEWIQYGDVSARRRARAHITRGFRRQKATQSQKQKENNEAEKEGNSARHNAALVQQRRPNVSRYVETSQSHDQGSSSAPATHLVQRPLLRRTLGSGRGDPFDAFPVSLSPQGRALLDHCKLVYFSQNCRKQVTDPHSKISLTSHHSHLLLANVPTFHPSKCFFSTWRQPTPQPFISFFVLLQMISRRGVGDWTRKMLLSTARLL